MDFNPCMKHKVVRKAVRMFAEAELGPIAHDIDRDARFPWEVVEKMRPLQFFGLQAAKAYGGAELDSISYAITIEEISRVSAAVGLCLTVHNGVGVYPIERFGTEEQKRRFLPAMTAGERIGAFCLTEANAGSDAGGVETVAVRAGADYVINGTKIFVTNGGVCGTSLIFAITDSQNPQRSACVFIVERETPGFTVGEIEDLCGMRANPVSSLFLEECRVPETNLLGRPGDGLKIGLVTLDAGRIGIAAQALGLAQGAFEDAVRYSKERQQFKKPLSSFQTIQNYLADMATEIDAARLLLYRACAAKDAGRAFGAEAAMAKLYAEQVVIRVSEMALRIHGGIGYTQAYPLERHFRDVRSFHFEEGTEEIQKLLIARYLLK